MGEGEKRKEGFSPSALSLFRFHLSPFPPETPATQARVKLNHFGHLVDSSLIPRPWHRERTLGTRLKLFIYPTWRAVLKLCAPCSFIFRTGLSWRKPLQEMFTSKNETQPVREVLSAT